MMRFNGAFELPAWIMGMAEHVRSTMLIRLCQGEAGVTDEANAGAWALAEWIVADPERAARQAARTDGILFMGDQVTRLLAGAIVPAPMESAAIEEATGGAVRWDAWNAPYSGTPEPVDLPLAATEPAADPEVEAEPVPVLGEVAAGPLWRARSKGRRLVVTGGLGVAFNMTHAAGELLWRDLGRIYAPSGGTPPGVSPAHL